LYNILTLNLFTHVTNNSCKYSQDEFTDAKPSNISQYNENL